MAPSTTDFASAVLVLGPGNKIPLIFEDWREEPFWKIPAGRNEPGETPVDTALRELREETGLKLKPTDLVLLFSEERTFLQHTHTFYLFGAIIDSFAGLRARGLEGEHVALFDDKELDTMMDLLPAHRKLLVQIGRFK